MKIYTKTGDKGDTSLIGGKRVSKSDVRIESYGTVDELIAHVGMLRDLLVNHDANLFLLHIQDRLMVCAAILAADSSDGQIKLPILEEKDISLLEKKIDQYEETLPPLSSFIIPGGHPVVSQCHITRTVCRRAERLIIRLLEESKVPNLIIIYINRLSDYLFVLGRKLSADFKVVEYNWKPEL
jgi:cob(I)alamin adenosyltransferase